MRNVSLSFRSEYSVDSGILGIADLLDRAREFRYDVVGLVDRHTLVGAEEFLSGAAQRGLAAVVGVELSLASLGEFELARNGDAEVPSLDLLSAPRTFPIVLHAEGTAGRETLNRLVSLAQARTGGGGSGRPLLFFEDLARDHDGLIAQSPGLAGEVSCRIQRGQADLAERLALRLAEVFGRSAFFLGLTLTGGAAAVRLAGEIRSLSARTGIPLIASDRVDHGDPGRRSLLATRQILSGHEPVIVDPRSDEGLFRSPLDRRRLYRDDPGALENEARLAERLLAKGSSASSEHPPVAAVGEADHRLRILGESRRPANPQLGARFDAELEAITGAGLAPWFLIAHELLRYARARSIRLTPLGGAARSSLVAWTLGLTDVDPVSAGLSFARFLVEAEKGIPEMVVGAGASAVPEVETYLEQRYPGLEVTRPARVVRLTPREALLAAARRLDLPETDRAAALRHITNGRTPDVALAVARDLRLARLYRAGGVVRDWLDLARGLQGLPVRVEADPTRLVLRTAEIAAPLTIRFESSEGGSTASPPDRKFAGRLAAEILSHVERRNPDVASRYRRRVTGEEPRPVLDPRIQPILAGTQGLLFDDEQLAALPRVLAGFDHLDAERFRRALIGPEVTPLELRRWRDRFVEGAVERGMTPASAETIFQSVAAAAPTLADRATCAATAMSIASSASIRAPAVGNSTFHRRHSGDREVQLDLALPTRGAGEPDDQRKTGTWGHR